MRTIPRGSLFCTGALVALLMGMLTGCSTLGSGGSVGEIHLFGVPVALNLDGGILPNGIGVRVYASAREGAQGIAVTRGRVEILMFDNPSLDLDPRGEKPLKVWSFSATQLQPFQTHTSLGEGYQLALKWGTSLPAGKVVTVIARYKGPKAGEEYYSSPNAVAISMK